MSSLTNTVSIKWLWSNCNGLFLKSGNFCERLREDSVAPAEQRLPNWKQNFYLNPHRNLLYSKLPDKVTRLRVQTLPTPSCWAQNPLRVSITGRLSRKVQALWNLEERQVNATVGICAGPAASQSGLAEKHTRHHPLTRAALASPWGV